MGRGGEDAGLTQGSPASPSPPSLALCSGGWWSRPLSGTFWLSWGNRPYTLLAPSPTPTFPPKLLKQLSSQLEEIQQESVPCRNAGGWGVPDSQPADAAFLGHGDCLGGSGCCCPKLDDVKPRGFTLSQPWREAHTRRRASPVLFWLRVLVCVLSPQSCLTVRDPPGL